MVSDVQLHMAPVSDSTPYPVTIGRVREVLFDLNGAPQHLADHQLQVLLEGQLFKLCLGSSSSQISIRTAWDTEQNFDRVEERLFAASDTWNRERYFPTVYTLRTAHDTAEVVADHLTPCRSGLSDLQLEDALRVGITTGLDAIRFMQDAACSVLGMLDDDVLRQ